MTADSCLSQRRQRRGPQPLLADDGESAPPEREERRHSNNHRVAVVLHVLLAPPLPVTCRGRSASSSNITALMLVEFLKQQNILVMIL